MTYIFSLPQFPRSLLSKSQSLTSGEMGSAHFTKRATALLLLLFIVLASLAVWGSGDSEDADPALERRWNLPLASMAASNQSLPGLMGTAFPAPEPSPASHVSQSDLQAITTLESAESHSTQTALVVAGSSDAVTTTTSLPGALAGIQSQPSATRSATPIPWTSQSTADGIPAAAWWHSSVAALSSQLAITNPSLRAGGPGVLVPGTSTSTLVAALPVTLSVTSTSMLTTSDSSMQTNAQSDQGSLPQTTQTGTSTSNPKTSGSPSQSSTQISGNQTPAATGDYALTIGPSGEIGLQSVPTGSAQTSTGIAEAHTPTTGLASTQGALTSLRPVAIPTGNYGDGGLRPWITSSSNGSLGGTGTTWNTSSVQPYVGGANRRTGEATGWWFWSSTAILAVTWLYRFSVT